MKDRIFINGKYRDFVDELKNKKILDIDNTTENKDIFILLAALGIDSPKEIDGAKHGFIRKEYLHTYEIALITAMTLGNISENEDVDKYFVGNTFYDNAEKFVEAGFGVLKQKIEDDSADEELFRKKLMEELEILYDANVKADLNVEV